MKFTYFGSIAVAATLTLTGCTAAIETLKAAGVPTEDIETVVRVGSSIVKSMEEITPEQEYYIGRSIAANIFNRYRIYENSAVQKYIHQIGMQVAYASDQPSLFGGYHFMVLDSDEINAFATPGGFIFVTRGMLRCADSEDAVAAILAHEVAHVTHRHGISSIKKSRWTKVGTLLGTEAAKRYTDAEVSELVSTFEASLDDVINTLVVNGYSRSYEEEADATALAILNRLGYNPHALISMLNTMHQKLKPGGLDFSKTHPDPEDRIEAIGPVRNSAVPSARTSRYKKYLARI